MELAVELLNESMRTSMCVRDDTGWCCLYHAGFEDALNLARQRISYPEYLRWVQTR